MDEGLKGPPGSGRPDWPLERGPKDPAAAPGPHGLGGAPGHRKAWESYLCVQMLRARGPRASEGCAGVLPSHCCPLRPPLRRWLRRGPRVSLQRRGARYRLSAWQACSPAGWADPSPGPTPWDWAPGLGEPGGCVTCTPEARPHVGGCRSTGRLGVQSPRHRLAPEPQPPWAGPLCLSAAHEILSW